VGGPAGSVVKKPSLGGTRSLEAAVPAPGNGPNVGRYLAPSDSLQ
jgi:hypothetical protein